MAAAGAQRAVEDLGHYPDPDCHDLVQSIAAHGDYPVSCIVPANARPNCSISCCGSCPAGGYSFRPAYIDYARAARLAGKPAEIVAMAELDGFRLDRSA